MKTLSNIFILLLILKSVLVFERHSTNNDLSSMNQTQKTVNTNDIDLEQLWADLPDFNKPVIVEETTEKVEVKKVEPKPKKLVKTQTKQPVCQPLATYRKELYQTMGMKVPKFSGRKIKIAIIDSGLDFTIPAFWNKIYRPTEITVNGKTQKIELPKEFYGINLVGKTTEEILKPHDSHGHGTHVAGIIIGLFPNAQILPIKNYDGYNESASFAKAIETAINMGVDIINISGGGPKADKDELAMIKLAEKKGIIIVSASGNDAIDLTTDADKYYPASYKTSNIISVMSHNNRGIKSGFSNYSPEYTDLMALGGEVKSYYVKDRTKETKCQKVISGTSQATPFVTATVAMLMAKNPTWNHKQIKQVIMDSVDKVEDFNTLTKSSGKLNITRTLAKNQ